MKRNATTRFFNFVIAICAAFFCASCTGENTGTSFFDIPEGTVGMGDGGDFSPTADGNISPCAKGADGNCAESADNTDSVSIDTTRIDFGLSEQDAMECQSIAIPGGLSYAAEIDDTGNAEEFAFLTAAGTVTPDRTEGSGEVTVCYLRGSVGTHTGQFKLVINVNSNASAYGYVILLTGQTLEPFFSISSPTQGQIIDERAGHNEGKNDDEGDWLLTARGSVNLDLTSVLADGLDTPVIITSAGVKYGAVIAADGGFSTGIAVPQVPGIYDVSFSVDTNEDSALIKTMSVVVADAPDFEITVKDLGGSDVQSGVPSDIQDLVVGFKVKNLNVAGSDQNAMPVQISRFLWNGEDQNKDISLWYAADQSWCAEGIGLPAEGTTEDYAGFDGTTTYCVPLSDILDVQSGENTITATATNALGTATSSFTLILDYNKPVISISSPQENQLLPASTQTLTVSGTVENYAPLEEGATPPAVQEGDTGSYCRVADGTETDAACPVSSVQLWINTNTGKHAIYVYPQLDSAYDGLSESEIAAKIENETPERCRDADDAGTMRCNLPKGSFELNLDLPDDALATDLNLYANVLQMRAESLAGEKSHRTIAVKTFFTGTTNRHAFHASAAADSNGKISIVNGSLTAGGLGSLNDATGIINRAPIMLNLSEGILKDPDVIRILENYLNENMPFSDVINGSASRPLDDDGNVNLEADFQRQHKKKYGRNYGNFYTDLADEDQEDYIQQALHSSSMELKEWALLRYQGIGVMRGRWPSDTAFMNFFDRNGDPQTHYNVARDSCDQTITTAFVPLATLQNVFKHVQNVRTDEYYDVNDIPKDFREWPEIAGTDIDFDDYVSGRWIIQSVEFQEGSGKTGAIDIDACIVPENADVDSCDDDIPDKKGLLPAIWGHFISYNLVENGLLGEPMAGSGIDDPTMPMLWSIGKLRIKLHDVVKIEKVQVDGQWTNKISMDQDGIGEGNIAESNITIVTHADTDPITPESENLHDPAAMGANSIQIYPYSRCADYYQEQLDLGKYHDSGDGWNHIPFGCDQEYPEWNFPIILERNSMQGRDLYNSPLINQGESYYLLTVVWQGVIDTFAKIVRCLDEESLNPILNPEAFPYPSWVPETEKLAMEFSLVEEEGELSVVATDDVSSAQKSLMGLDLNLTQADLNANEPDDPSSTSAFTVRLPFEITIDDVMNPNLFLTSPVLMANLSGKQQTGGSVEKANVAGHLIRETGQGDGTDSLDNYPPSCTSSESCKDPEQDLFLGASLNAEELFNSMTYLLYKKGPFSLLDFFKSEDFDPEDLEVNSSYSVGLDKVVLGRFGICNSIAGGLNTDLPPGILFANIASQFDYPATHWDIQLDKNYPPTLAMSPITGEGVANPKLASDIKIGLTNVRISVKELENATDAPDPEDPEPCVGQTGQYCVGKEVVQIRIDGVLSLKTIYHEDQALLYVFIEPYDEQNLHWSVVPGKGGVSYDDVDVIYSLATEIVPNLFAKLGKTFSPDLVSEDGTAIVPTMSLAFNVDANGYLDVESLADVEVTFNMDEVSNGTCDGLEIPIYASEAAESAESISGETVRIAPRSAPVALTARAETTALTRSPATIKTGSHSKISANGLSKKRLSTGGIDRLTGLDLTGTCTEDGYKTGLTGEDDPFAEALCDFGVEWIKVKPAIEFDNDNGYLHLSSELLLEVYDWLVETTGK